jgi:dinuclear metal center YbgI/SA1388 family protein
MKQVNGHEIIELFENFSPKHLAVEGDSIGLQIGRLNHKISNVLVALDVDLDVVEEAIEKGTELIIAHHPPIYHPLKSIRTDTPRGQLIEKLIKNNIAVYAAHTNLDIAEGGMNDWLAEALKLNEKMLLTETSHDDLGKMLVFIPRTHEDLMRKSLGHAGAGAIGNYQYCSYTSHGTGRFFPVEGANPFLGEQGKPEEVEEVKIEVIYPLNIEKKILKAMFSAHPYEEPAYDLIELRNHGKSYGLGRIGTLENEMSLLEFSKYVKEKLDVSFVRAVGDLNKKIKKVAVLGGDGNKYISVAKRKGADVFVSGDIYYHNAQEANELNLAIVDPGHNMEKIMKSGVADYMNKKAQLKGWSVQFHASTIHTDPFKVI